MQAIDGLNTKLSIPARRPLATAPSKKYAVRVGGGAQSPLRLYDTVMIKDNHIKGQAGSSGGSRARANIPYTMNIEGRS